MLTTKLEDSTRNEHNNQLHNRCLAIANQVVTAMTFDIGKSRDQSTGYVIPIHFSFDPIAIVVI